MSDPVPLVDVEFAPQASPCCGEAGWRALGSDAKYMCLACNAPHQDDDASDYRTDSAKNTPMYHQLTHEQPSAAGMLALARLRNPDMHIPGTVALTCRHGRFFQWSPRPLNGPAPDCINRDMCQPTECFACGCDLEHDGSQWVARDTSAPLVCEETGGVHQPVGVTVPV